MKVIRSEHQTPKATVSWDDEPGSRNRQRRLIVVHTDDKGTTMKLFQGETIPGAVAVLSSNYNKNGQWSHFKYEIAYNPSVTTLVEVKQSFSSPALYFSASTWAELWKEFVHACPQIVDMKPEEFQSFIRTNFSKEAEHIDANEKALAELSSTETAIERAKQAYEKAKALLSTTNGEKLAEAIDRLEQQVDILEQQIEYVSDLQKEEESRIQNNPFMDFFSPK